MHQIAPESFDDPRCRWRKNLLCRVEILFIGFALGTYAPVVIMLPRDPGRFRGSYCN